MPNCTQETSTHKIEFGRLGRRLVQGQFDGGSMTSDAGVMLLGATDRKLGLMQAAARCIADPTQSATGHPQRSRPAAPARVWPGAGLGGLE